MYAMNALAEANIPEQEWSIGGGTVLASVYNHRLSKDIAVFLEDIRALTSLSPSFNKQAENALDYDEMSQYISLTYPEGKVDFIASPHITEFPAQNLMFFDQNVRLDDPVEIVSKKIYFRGNQTLPRDIFDLAIVYDSDRKLDLINMSLSMLKRFEVFKKHFEIKFLNLDFKLYSDSKLISILPGGEKIIGKEADICKNFINSVEKINQIIFSDFKAESVKDVFSRTAKSVLTEANMRWEENTNQKIIQKLSVNYSSKYIEEAMKYSPIPETEKTIRNMKGEKTC